MKELEEIREEETKREAHQKEESQRTGRITDYQDRSLEIVMLSWTNEMQKRATEVISKAEEMPIRIVKLRKSETDEGEKTDDEETKESLEPVGTAQDNPTTEEKQEMNLKKAIAGEESEEKEKEWQSI